jgi:hypothetical protein
MQSVLDQQAAEAAAVQQANTRLQALQQDLAADETLSPEQAQRLDELLQQARADLERARSEQEAESVLANAAQQVSQLSDSNADAQTEALGAMSETLSQEPLTRPLGDALAHNDPTATAQAAQALAAQADQLSDIQRQALSRALQRAANVGRAEPRGAAALRNAAQALNEGKPADAALEASAQALQQALQSASAQATLRSTGQRLQDLRTALGSGQQLEPDVPLPTGNSLSTGGAGVAPEPGRTVPLDASGGARFDSSSEQARGAGQEAARMVDQGQPPSEIVPSENVFVPGTPSDGAYDQDLVRQPFSVRGAPRPYREVLNQYAQAGRDYVDRADIAPNVRDLVKQYFSKLEEGE